MSKMQGLQQALKNNSGKAPIEPAEPNAMPQNKSQSKPRTKSASRDGKEYIGAWLNADFGTSIRMVQLRQRRDVHGNKIHLEDLHAEALNDLFRKYDVPTVHHK